MKFNIRGNVIFKFSRENLLLRRFKGILIVTEQEWSSQMSFPRTTKDVDLFKQSFEISTI